MKKSIIITAGLITITASASAADLFPRWDARRGYQTYQKYQPPGTYRGQLSNNPYAPDSTSNPYGRYGSRYSRDSINNPYGYGSPYRLNGPNNPYGKGMRIYGD